MLDLMVRSSRMFPTLLCMCTHVLPVVPPAEEEGAGEEAPAAVPEGAVEAAVPEGPVDGDAPVAAAFVVPAAPAVPPTLLQALQGEATAAARAWEKDCWVELATAWATAWAEAEEVPPGSSGSEYACACDLEGVACQVCLLSARQLMSNRPTVR